jgi:hypothetical protein
MSKDIKRYVLGFQNDLRKNHGARKLAWRTNLKISATQQCKKMAGLNWKPDLLLPNVGSNTFHGLNIRRMSQIAGLAVRHWYGTGKHYDFHASAFVAEAAEFTRLVWKGVKSVGCGYAKYQEFSEAAGVMNHVLFCCHYYPAGNFQGRFDRNVMRPKKKYFL